MPHGYAFVRLAPRFPAWDWGTKYMTDLPVATSLFSDRARVQLLLWRTGFGATPAQVDAASDRARQNGYAAVVDDVLAFPDPPAPPPLPVWPSVQPTAFGANEAREYQRARLAFQTLSNDARSGGITMLTRWWADRLRTSAAPLQENLTLFWHDHFATALDKVDRPLWMLNQNQLFRAKGAGKFVDLLTTAAKDTAMLVWLDGTSNVKGHPNENWAREVMELFTLGIGNYTEADVREAARACTGWTVNYSSTPVGAVSFVQSRFDDKPKTVLGQTGNFNMDDFSRLLAAHPETAKRVSRKLFAWFVSDDPTEAELTPMLDAWKATDGDIRAVLRALFLSDAFTPARATRAYIKHPVAWTVGTARALEAPMAPESLLPMFENQGMRLFFPPTVGGWTSGLGWISPTNQVLRFNLAGQIVAKSPLLAGRADSAFLTQIADRLGGLPLSADLRAMLLVLGASDDGKKAVTQVLLASPAYQAR